MATSVIIGSGTGGRYMRVGATLVASAWADVTTFYTVPDNKRLVLKGKLELNQGNNPGASFDILRLTSDTVENTVVIPQKCKLQQHASSGAFYAAGFLEDDI